MIGCKISNRKPIWSGCKYELAVTWVLDRPAQQETTTATSRSTHPPGSWHTGDKHLRLKVNAAKGGTGRVWESKFLGFRLDREKRIGVAPESVGRFKIKVREMWPGNQSRTSNQLRDAWVWYVRG